MNLADKIYWRIPYRWRWWWYDIRDFFFPRQKWLTKKISNGWMDKVELHKIVAFESIVHFVEKEEAFERIEWSSDPEHEEAAKAFKRAYDTVKLKLPILEKKAKKLWQDPDLNKYFHEDFLVPIPNQKPEINKRYMVGDPSSVQKNALDALRETEKEIEELTQEVVEIVAKYREFMWT